MRKTESPLDFGCGPVDLACDMAEMWAESMADNAHWLAESTIGSQSLDTESGLWDAAISEVGQWMPFAILVMLITLAVGAVHASLTLDKRRMGWVAIMSVMAIPSTLLALTVGGAVLDVADTISAGILTRLGGGDGFINLVDLVAIEKSAGWHVASVLTGGMSDLLSTQGMIFPTIMVLSVLNLGLLLMTLMLAFRNVAVMVLIAFSPLAFAMITNKGGFEIVRKWAWALVAMIIAKPLMFGVLALVMRAAGEDVNLFSAEGFAVLVGLFVTALMPMMAYQFFNFLGAGAAADAGEGVGSRAAQSATGAGRSIVHTSQSLWNRGASAVRGGRGGGGGSQGAAPSTPAATQQSRSTGGSQPGQGGKPSGDSAPKNAPEQGNGNGPKSTPPRSDSPQGEAPRQGGSTPSAEPPRSSPQPQPSAPGSTSQPPASKPQAPSNPRW